MNIDHVGLVTADLEAAAALYVAAFDLRVDGRETVPDQGVDVLWLRGADGAAIEMLSPISEESPVARFMAKRGEGMHHLAIRVPNLTLALERCRESGLTLIDQVPRVGSGGTRVAFIHPKSAYGVLIELVEEGPEP